MRMYLFDDYLNEVLTEKTPDYVALSHAGHGVNSYALNYQLVIAIQKALAADRRRVAARAPRQVPAPVAAGDGFLPGVAAL